MKYDPEILVSLYLNDNESMTEEQLHCLDSWINASSENMRQFVHVSYIHRAVHDYLAGNDLQKRFSSAAGDQEGGDFLQGGYFEAAFWEALSQHEKKADPAVLPASPKPKEIVTDVRRRKAMLKCNDRKAPVSLWISLGASAAVLLLLIYIAHTPRMLSQPVAKVFDALDAKWDVPLQSGDMLYDGGSYYTLEKGIVKIGIDNGVILHLEAPSQFAFMSQDRLILSQGRLTATVPRSAVGFMIHTPNSQIIDLGTEFGVHASINGETEVHLFNGKVNLISSLSGSTSDSHILKKDEAKIVDMTGNIFPVQLVRKAFVRGIDSQHNIVWRGEPICLADIVGGGNGLGTGLRGSSIDPADGQWHALADLLAGGGYSHPSHKCEELSYRPVSSSSFVDGVFVPKPQNGSLIVSTEGHVFQEAPQISGYYWFGVIVWDAAKGRSIVFNGDLYGTPQKPALLMHASVGITFDLNAIRQSFPGRSITEFVSLYSIADAYANKKVQPSADFWVLVDGNLRFSKRNVTVLQTGTVRIPISKSDRFLTLVTTEGDDNTSAEAHGMRAVHNDWCVWGSPVLKVE